MMREDGFMPDRPHQLDHVDNSDKIARKLPRRYLIQGLAEALLPIFMKADLNKEYTREAVEQTIEELFR